MTPATDIPDEAAEKLLRLMTDADGGQPFMTHKAAATLGAFILAELGKIAQQSEGVASVRKEYGTPAEIAKIYGLHRVTMAKHLAAWAAAGKVQVRQIFDEVTRAYGNKRYNLADVDRLMKEAAESEREKHTAAPIPLP